MSDTVDLVDRLADAARSAVLARRQAIEAGSSNLAGVMIELDLSNGGAIIDVTSQLSWRDVVRKATRRAG